MSKIVAKADRQAYLANVLSIAKIGGKVSATESLVLRSIIRSIDGTQEDIVAAGKMLGDGRYQVHLPESLNERMDNLQDMIMVAIADGNLSPMESAPIEKMAKAMRYSQADVDLAVRRAEIALRRIGKKPQSVTSEGKPPPIPEKPLKRPAREISKKSPPPVPESIPEGPKPSPEAPPMEEAAGADPGGKSAAPVREADTAGQDVGPAEEAEPATEETIAHVPDSIPLAVKACMKCRAESENPETYCFGVPDGASNPWGCRLSNMSWEPGAPWLELGSFRDDVTFVFDKHAIAERLTSRLAAALNCPHLDTEYTEAAFGCLPERAVIGPRWLYRIADADDANAVTVKTTRYVHGCAVSTTLSVDGVDPIGPREAMKIIRKAGRQL